MSVAEYEKILLEEELDEELDLLQDSSQEWSQTTLYQAARDGRADLIEGIWFEPEVIRVHLPVMHIWKHSVQMRVQG